MLFRLCVSLNMFMLSTLKAEISRVHSCKFEKEIDKIRVNIDSK